jgi:probable O-glycosylation ligase (exosortase A-associated)
VRDLIVFLAVMGSLPYCFRKPYFGLVVFSWLAYMRVQDLCWGFARPQRFSFYVAIAMFLGFLLFERGRFFAADLRNWLMVALAVLVSVSVALTRYEITERVINFYVDFLKILAVAMLTTALVNTQERLRILVWTVALSFGFFGIKSGLWGVLTGGARPILRGPGGLLQDNNDFSLALTMNIPFLFYLGLSEPQKWMRRGMIAAMGLTIVTIVLTHSRGGFLAMSATLAVITWRSRNRVIGFTLAGIALLLFLLLLPQGARERLGTLKKVQDDSSAQARLKSWGIALQMIRDNPVTGVGFQNYRSAYGKYDPSPVLVGGQVLTFVAHNSYLQIAAESGLPALGVYLTLIGSSFLLLRRIRLLALARFHTGWILNYVRMFEASLAGFVIGAIFINRAHFDFIYHLIAIIVAFAMLARRELVSEEAYPLRRAPVATLSAGRGFSAARIPQRSGVPLGSPRGG